MNIGITGAQGLIGFHLRAFLHKIPNIKVLLAGRETFADFEALLGFVAKCDAVVHLASMNRGNEEEVACTNIQITEKLVAAFQETDVRPHVIFSSSNHIDRDTLYGVSKRVSTEILSKWASKVQAKFTSLILPGVFGEYGKPFYNSVVSTFCHQLAHNEVPQIHTDAQMQQMHAQEVARLILDTLENGVEGELRPLAEEITVKELLCQIKTLSESYNSNIFPNLSNPFCRDLFNTYRSYLPPNHFPRPLVLHKDPRGELYEVVKGHSGGQTFLSTTRPGITRGNHYHLHKVERFVVIHGQATIKLRRLFTDDIICFEVEGNSPVFIDIPTFYTHNITNIGKGELLTLFWTNELFDPNSPDTNYERVE